MGKANKFLVLAIAAISFLIGVSPVQAALPNLECNYWARDAFQSSMYDIYPGKVLQAPDCAFPSGTTVSYTWYHNNQTSLSQTFTVPDALGMYVDLSIVATNPNYNRFNLTYRAVIKCVLPTMSISRSGSHLSPNNPISVTVSGADPGAAISARVGRGGVVTKLSNTSWRYTIAPNPVPINDGGSVIWEQTKQGCVSNEIRAFFTFGIQLPTISFGPETGSIVRVGSPVVLKNLDNSSLVSKYFWHVSGVVVGTSSSYVPSSADLDKQLGLELVLSDKVNGWADRIFNVDTPEGASRAIIQNSLPVTTPTPTPTPKPTSPVVGNPSGGTPGVIGGGEIPKPNVSSQPSPSASQSASPSATPVKTVVPAKPVAPVVSRAYASCTALRKAFVNGVARDATALNRYKAKAKPILNNSVYRLNIKLDTDKDGLACER